MTDRHHAPSASPRWPILATLVAVVLGLHLVLLAGDIRLPWPGGALATLPALPSPPTVSGEPVNTALAPRASPVRVSSVRWIVPAPVVVPVPAPKPKAKPKPKPAPRAAPLARVEPIEAPDLEPVDVAVAETEPDAPPPIEVHEDPAPPLAETIDAPPAEAIAAPAALPPETPAAEPLPTSDIANTDTADTTEAALPPEDMLLAAAASRSRGATAAVKLPPAQPPASMRLQYDVTGNVKGIHYKAHGALDWAVADGRYDARLEMRVMLLGSRSQASTGRIGPNGLMPERFADKSRSEKATHFDAAQQRIRFSNNAPEVPLQPGAQDRLSLFMQLAGLLQARPQAYATGQTVDMQVAGTGDAPVWRFEVGEESTIRVPAGEFRVRHLVRQPRKAFDSTVEMWLAPTLGYMPARLRITQPNGDIADQRLMQMP